MTTWRSYFLDHIDLNCDAAKGEIKQMADDARKSISRMTHFHARSLGQKRRYQRIKGESK